jgi:nucleoside-diphosphate-sugar epimerase
MSSPQSQNLTIAVLGATGGCALHFLVHALTSNYTCSALVRTPPKLLRLLAKHHVPESTIATHLTITRGNIRDGAAVTAALAPSGRPADLIVSGIGGSPSFSPNPLRPTLDDPSICADATAAVLASLAALQAAARPQDRRMPLFVVISSTGISDFGRDIPLAMVPLYHWMLPVPHADKKAMERLLVAESAKPAGGVGVAGRVIEGFVAVRPSLLTDGPATEGRVRVGVEEGKVDKRGVGYTISRADVGKWIFENVVVEWEGRGRWVDKFVSLST